MLAYECDKPLEHRKPPGMADQLHVQRQMKECARPLVEAAEFFLPQLLDFARGADHATELAAVHEIRCIGEVPLDRQLHERQRLAFALVTVRPRTVMKIGRYVDAGL